MPSCYVAELNCCDLLSEMIGSERTQSMLPFEVAADPGFHSEYISRIEMKQPWDEALSWTE
jgi:hypothetical protein